MQMEKLGLDDVFDRRLTFPDMSAQRRFARLVGLDEAKSRLTKLLGVLVNPDGSRTWAQKFYPGSAQTFLDYVDRRPPLVILSGDVGAGKTELAETVGDAVARLERTEVTLYPLSLASRGSGAVGEMTKLVSAAFDQTIEAAGRLKRSAGKAAGGIILLVDEADALTQNREDAQMHHEDRAGVNAFIRGVDRLAEQRLPVAVILCTNRLGSIDPAVQRRAADIFTFGRPNEMQRRALVEGPLREIGFSMQDIERMVQATGATPGRAYGYTFSDLTQRLMPTLFLDAYPDNKITPQRALELAGTIKATPPFKERER